MNAEGRKSENVLRCSQDSLDNCNSTDKNLRMTVAEDIRKQLEIARQDRRSFQNDPRKARKWLIRMGVLDKSGKRLARRYR